MTWTDWYQYGLMDKQFVAYLALPCKLGCDWSLNIFHWQILYWCYWVFQKCKFTKIWQKLVTKFCSVHRILFWSISTTSEVTNVGYIFYQSYFRNIYSVLTTKHRKVNLLVWRRQTHRRNKGTHFTELEFKLI